MTSQLRRVTAATVAGLALLGLSACGDDEPSASDPTSTTAQEHGCAVAEQGRVTIVAKDLAWDVDCIQAPQGNPLTIVEDNQDSGVAHNLHITDLPDEPATPLAEGPGRQELDLDGSAPAGSYSYKCDIHPNMTGELELLDPLAEGSAE